MIFQRQNTNEKYDIPVNGKRNIKTACPVCSGESSKKNAKDLSINNEVGKCHRCEAVFHLPVEKKEEYTKPEWQNNTKLSDNVVKYFEGRGISQFTLRRMNVTEGLEYMPQEEKKVNTIQFNYVQDGELINVKYRDAKKNFKMVSGAKRIFWNIDAIKDTDKVVITEGEIDALTYAEMGIDYVVSVPNGAGKTTQNLEYLDNCIDYFDDKEIIYIATDTDDAGMALRNELVRRLGAGRCRKIEYGECKDANELLKSKGRQAVEDTIKEAKEFPIEGVFRVENFKDEFDNLFRHGLSGGVSIFHDNLNDLLQTELGRLKIVTGIPGYGKSEYVDEYVSQLNLLHGYKPAYFSPENFPISYHAAKIAEKITGKKFRSTDMGENIKILAEKYINDNYSFIYPKNEDYKLDTILQKGQDLVYRHGIKILVIDPWNRIEHQRPSGDSETAYIGQCLTKMTNFAQRHNVLVILVAHPRKMEKDQMGNYKIPNLYDISGSANFFNQCDYGVTVHRENKGKANDYIAVHVQKVRFKYLGSGGLANFVYNSVNGRFSSCRVDNDNSPYDYNFDFDNYLEKKPEQRDFWDEKHEEAPF